LALYGTETLVAWATRSLAFCYRRMGNDERSQELHEQNLGRARRLGDLTLQAATLAALAVFAFEQGRTRDSATLSRESLTLAISLGDQMMAISRLCTTANTLTVLGSATAAAELVACAKAHYAEIGASEPWVERMNEVTLGRIHDAIDEPVFEAASQRGRSMNIEDAARVGLAALDQVLEGLQ
jgi:hypothetical protein